MAITDRRIAIKPYEYPHLLQYRDAIRHSYWVHTEFTLSGDVQDWYTRVDECDRELLKRTMLAISQIEVEVKTFWARIYDRLPKPEIAEVGMTFAESEVRHANAYSHLLDLLHLNDAFLRLVQEPVFAERIAYLEAAKQGIRQQSIRDFVFSLMLFSSFVEHISLFGQFLILMAYNKHGNLFKGISNIVEATSKEEQIHGMFGIELVRIFRQEFPEYFDRAMEEAVYEMTHKAYCAEKQLLGWLFERGDTRVITYAQVDEFLKSRFNRSLEYLGYLPLFEVDQELLETTRWFDDEVITTKENDFFNKRSVNYNKKVVAYTADNLF